MSDWEFPRQFVSVDDTLSEWSQMEPYFADLTSRPVETLEALNEWLLDWSELEACIDQVGTELYVRMTCQTDDAERKAAYLDFVEQIEPRCKPMWHTVRSRHAQWALRWGLPRERFAMFDRRIQNAVELYREENVALEVEEAKLEQRFQEIAGAMTVQYEGKEQTLQQVSAHLESTDRGVRETVWKLISGRRLEVAGAIEEVFDGLFSLRHRIALNAGFSDFRDYAFRVRERFDYTPDDCLAFHEAIEKTCVPLLRERQSRRQRLLGVDTLRPWDLSVDPGGRPPLRPFKSSAELVAKCGRLMDAIGAELGDQFRAMAGRGDLDLESRKGKAPGGYQSTFQESRHPFIFMNAAGLQRDVRTLVHECGHAFHVLACRAEPLTMYRNVPIEFAEVASMGMELLAYDHLDVFYEGEALDRARRDQLESIVTVLPWIATIDAFQHWLYTHPEHTRDARREAWLGLHERFGGIEDFSGQEEALARRWQRQLHLFSAPFYYIEYGIAQLGALQIWQNARGDRRAVLAAYRKALSLGGSRSLPALFEAAGIRFDFSSETLGAMMQAVQEGLRSLDD